MLKRFVFACFAVAAIAVADEFKVGAALPDGQIHKAGAEIRVAYDWKCPDGYVMAAWKIGAYIPSLPYQFADKTGVKVSVSKDPKWSSVMLVPWKWLDTKKRESMKSLEAAFGTAGWPKGDYRLQVTLLFRKKDAPDVKTDKYVSANFVFSLE